MARNEAYYQALGRIQDQNLRDLLRVILEKLIDLEARVAALEA